MTEPTPLRLAVLVVLATSVAARADDSVPNLVRLGGTEITHGDLAFTYIGPMIVSDENDPNSPSFALATIKTAKQKTRLLFLMAFKNNGRQITGAGWTSAPNIKGPDIKHATTAIIHDTKRIEFAFSYDTSDKTTETFSINDKVLDDKSPRIFLVDLGAKQPRLTGIKAKLPESVPDFTTNDAEQLGKEWRTMIDELKRLSPHIRKFIDE